MKMVTPPESDEAQFRALMDFAERNPAPDFSDCFPAAKQFRDGIDAMADLFECSREEYIARLERSRNACTPRWYDPRHWYRTVRRLLGPAECGHCGGRMR